MPQIPAGENHIGQAAPPLSFVDVTMTCDTAILAAGDVITDTATVTNAVRVNDGLGRLVSVNLIDEDDQGTAVDLYFMSANVSLGTKNLAPSISDADARNILGFVSIATGDYKDLGGVRVATKTNIWLGVKPAAGTRNIFVSAIVPAGTPTYTVNGLKLRLGFETA